MGKLLAVFVIAITLCFIGSFGRLDAQETQIHDCRVEGQLAFLQTARKWDEARAGASGNQYIILCMDSHGYKFSYLGKFCKPQDGGEYSNKYCYRLKNLQILTDIDIAMHDGFNDWQSQLWCERMRNFTQTYCITHGWFPDPAYIRR